MTFASQTRVILINSRSGNELAQYHIIGTVLSYIKLNYFYNVSSYKLTFTVVYYIIHRAGLSRKLVKIGGSSKPLEPPWLGPASIKLFFDYKLTSSHMPFRKTIDDKLEINFAWPYVSH